jgi:hypothetical protein
MALAKRERFLATMSSWLLILLCWTPSYAAPGKLISVILTADTEGQVEACPDCLNEARLGGLSHRAAAIARLRHENPSLLLVDAGNCLFGPDVMASGGTLIVSVYNTIGYDVVNFSYRDFRLGKTATLNLIQQAPNLFVSANLLDAKSKKTLTRPFIVKSIGGIRWVVMGVTQIPAGLLYLPHLQEQLDGITIQPPEEALAYWLPKAKKEADRVLLLYYGSYGGLKPIQERFGKEFSAILVGGSRPEYLPTDTIPPIVGTYDRGQYLATVQFTGTGPKSEAQITQVAVEPSLAPSLEIEKVLATFKIETPPSVTFAAREAEATTAEASTTSRKEDTEPSELIIGETLRLGMPIAEAMTLLGMPQGMRTEGKDAKEIRWMEYPDLGVSIGAKPGGKNIEFIEVQKAFKGRFRSGVKIGDSQTAVIANYGMPASMTPENASYPTEGIIFRLDDGKLVGAQVSTVKEGEPVKIEPTEKEVAAADSVPRSSHNQAVKIDIGDIQIGGDVAGQSAPSGKAYVVLTTRWENIHPKQEVEKSKLERKRDITMGVGGLGMKPSGRKTEYVEMDVAYKIERLLDHAYLLADGLAYALEAATEQVQGGVPWKKPFSLEKQGEIREARLVFLVSENAKHIAFQFFDYQYGHVTIPIGGDIEQARAGKALKNASAQSKTALAEMLVAKLSFANGYMEKGAPAGWRYAVLSLGGKSLSISGDLRNIIQIDPLKSMWLSTPKGHLYYGAASATAEDGRLRFSPEVYQYQEVAFLVPADIQAFDLGVRLRNEVTWLNLAGTDRTVLPKSMAVHRDGSVAEILMLGIRRESGKQVLDLGIHSLSSSGLAIQFAQFRLYTPKGEMEVDSAATEALTRRPPKPFLIPPGMFVRFELAYDTGAIPTQLHYRGFQIEARIPLKVTEPVRDLKTETETDTEKLVLVKAIELSKGETFGITLEKSAEGVRINFVQPDSAADKSGISVGDIVEAVDGKANKNAMALLKLLGAVSRGKRQRVVLMIRRGSESHRLTVTAK